MEELLLDIINSIWAGERINELSPDNSIALPATEDSLTAAVLAATGQDMVGDLGRAQLYDNVTFREQARLLVDEAFVEGAGSAAADNKRAAVLSCLEQYSLLFPPE